jgi:hypothetical protein
MKTRFLATVGLLSALFAGPVMAQDLQVNISYGEKAEKAFTKTYGERERQTIQELITTNLQRELGTQATRVDLVINDAKPNRPTFKQLGDNPALSFQSFGIGGADVSGRAFDAQGNLLGEVQYDWYGDIFWADTSWTWTDAERAFSRFSRLLAEKVPG